MGFFSLLKDPDNPKDFEVGSCHLNLWCLSGLLGRRLFTWDVGLRLKSLSPDFQSFQIALPSGTDGSGIEDLKILLLDQTTAQLIFGKPVKIRDQKFIDYGEDEIALGAIWIEQTRLLEKSSSNDFSLWAVKLASPLAQNSECYIRIRIQASDLRRCWTWKRLLFRKYGALIDLRFSDVREAWNVKSNNTLQDLIVRVHRLNFFVIVPANYHPISVNPVPHYTRILEGHAWQRYLRRKTRLFGKEKLAIFQWRNSDDITPDKPLRVFLDLNDAFRAFSGFNLLVFVVAFFCLSCSASYSVAHQGALVSRSLQWLQSHLRILLGSITVGAVLSVFAKIMSARSWFTNAILIFKRLERRVYNLSG